MKSRKQKGLKMAANEFKALIAKYLALRNVDTADFIASIGMNKSTYYRRMKEPELFTVAELRAIGNCLRIPREEIANIVLSFK